MKKYKSKIGWEIIIILVLVFAWIFYDITKSGINWDLTSIIAFSLLLLLIILIGYLLFSIRYFINFDKAELLVKIGVFKYAEISISKIHKIKETRTILSSPAASLDRLEVFYHQFNSVIISPKNKKEFIQDLHKINPEIKIKYRKTKK